MNSFLYLNEADESRLSGLLAADHPPPRPNTEQSLRLRELLSVNHRPGDIPQTTGHVALHDAVTLRSVSDPTDSYQFEIVMPQETDIDSNRLSVYMPISLAVIGRTVGSIVEWSVPTGERKMRIETIGKAAALRQGDPL